MAESETRARKAKAKLDSRDVKYVNRGAPRIPPHPWRGVVAGASNTGKTYAVLEHFILDPDSPFEYVIWCAPKMSLEQPKLQLAQSQAKMPIIFVEYLKGDRKALAAWLLRAGYRLFLHRHNWLCLPPKAKIVVQGSQEIISESQV